MNGLAIIEKTEQEAKGFFVDQDAIECARLNALTKKEIAKAEAAKREADRKHRKEQKAQARRKAYTIDTIRFILIRGGITGAVAWAGAAEMIHPAICIPVGLFCLCTACVRLGAWFGRGEKK